MKLSLEVHVKRVARKLICCAAKAEAEAETEAA
jgi:hypothetical protein